MFFRKYRTFILIILALSLTSLGGCVYWNTFYNAKKAFNEAEKSRRASAFGRGRINTGLYETAIEKSLKVIENYPNSKYYDDALFVLGVSYFYTEKYISSERRMRELLANYPDSKFGKEAELYLAKSKLALRDEKPAMEIFEKIFRSDFKREYKVEAAIALGNYHFDERDYERSRQYFQAIRDSLGSDSEKKMGQLMIADGYYNDFDSRAALGAYLQVLGMKPEPDEKYHSLYYAAQAAFRLMRISDGLDYLQTLATDETYFDSLAVIRLQIAAGYEYAEDIAQAEQIYSEVLEQEEKKQIAAEAAYRLGLIHQFDYDDLPKAKEFYDQTVKLDRNSVVGLDALQRSSDIGKIKTYARAALDSTASQEVIDEAAITQYQLAELYWFSLNKPDSAMIEMQYVVDSFPSSTIAPKAMVALAQMYRDNLGDSTKARELFERVLERYPRSDYVPQALEALELKDTPADTGYAQIYLDKAEKFLVDQENIDSARFYYRVIADNFPRSKYYPQAKFSLIWLQEQYNSPGDSSVYWAYTEFVDSFPGTDWALEAENRLAVNRPQSKARQPRPDTTDVRDERITDDLAADTGAVQEDEQALTPIEAVYIGPNGEPIKNAPIEPVEIREEFIYPVEAYRLGWEGDLYFQIFLDFSGEVTDYILKIRCESEEINREASEAVASMIFDPMRIPQEQQDSWMVYRFQVRKPEHLR
ncbi:MAG: tetratricopeptide repeat protein [Candidatus Zixiibacteriota bacterium]